jgi:hypothetical protein
MFHFDVQIDKPDIDEKYCQRHIERATKALARIISIEAAEEIRQKFNLKRQWISKGMRYEMKSSSPLSAEAEVFHKDIMISKHTGEDITGRLAVPTRYAKARFNNRIRRPRYLLKLDDVYVDPKGDIYKRLKRTKRKIFFVSKIHHFRERISLEEIAARPRPMDLY